MTRFISLVFAFLTIQISGFCSDKIDLSISSIDPALIKNAKAIVRYSNCTLTIFSSSYAEVDYNYAITILNENGDRNAVFMQFYDKFTKIEGISISILDKESKVIRKIKNDEIRDYSAIPGYSAYEDSRVKYFVPQVTQYPYTVKVEFLIILKGILGFPNWTPINDYNIALENSCFKVEVPEKMKIRYFEQNFPNKVEIETVKWGSIYTWKIENYRVFENENFSQHWMSYGPMIYVAPNDFELDGYPGNAETWQSFGNWIKTLNYQRDCLDNKTVLEIQNLVAKADDDYSKVKILYEYMQTRTRYVNISIGIGGWQPYEAQRIHRLGYGDCKALSNYMYSLLKAVGIKSYYTLVMAGEKSPQILGNFPSSQFNHAILCVPLKNDTLWLECTDQQMPCFYQGSFTDDREALVITEQGGKLVHTTVYDEHKNMKNRMAQFTIDTNGNALISSSTSYHCFYYDQMEYLMRSDEADKRKLITEDIQLPSFKLDSFKLKENKSRFPFIEEKLSITANNYGTKIKDRILLPLSVLSKDFTLPRKTKTRKSDVSIRRSYSCSDTIRYSIPENFLFESIPQPVILTSAFGEYQNHIVVKGNTLLFTRKLVMKKGKHPASFYNELYNFIDQIIEADNVKVSMKRKG